MLTDGKAYRLRIGLSEGAGHVKGLGGMMGDMQEACHIAGTFVAVNLKLLQGWLPKTHMGRLRQLFGVKQNLYISCVQDGVVKRGASGTAAKAIAVLGLLGRRLRGDRVAITGGMDLLGRVMPVADLPAKIAVAKKQQVRWETRGLLSPVADKPRPLPCVRLID
jgi:ATP-dependent Lon protease